MVGVAAYGGPNHLVRIVEFAIDTEGHKHVDGTIIGGIIGVAGVAVITIGLAWWQTVKDTNSTTKWLSARQDETNKWLASKQEDIENVRRDITLRESEIKARELEIEALRAESARWRAVYAANGTPEAQQIDKTIAQQPGN